MSNFWRRGGALHVMGSAEIRELFRSTQEGTTRSLSSDVGGVVVHQWGSVRCNSLSVFWVQGSRPTVLWDPLARVFTQCYREEN